MVLQKSLFHLNATQFYVLILDTNNRIINIDLALWVFNIFIYSLADLTITNGITDSFKLL